MNRNRSRRLQGIGKIYYIPQKSKQDDDGRWRHLLFGYGRRGSKAGGGGLFVNLVGAARGKMIELTAKSAKPSIVVARKVV